jgi:ubiquinone/menaquinone biosynthesis C-methylase UbiE
MRPAGFRAISPASTRARACWRSRRGACRARFVRGDAFELPFPARAFERVAIMSFYGHLDAEARERFLAEARRVAPELGVVDAALHDDDVEPEEIQERVLKDGSRWTVLKRFFTPEGLLDELGGGRVLPAGRCFVAVVSP